MMIGCEIFSGAGGMSIGAGMAGVDVRLAVEIDVHAAATFKFNHSESTVFNQDIRSIVDLPYSNKQTEQKILFGGPPCQGFSKSNHRTRNKENPNNWLFEEYVRIVKLWKPDWIVLENVRGILETEGGLFIDKIQKRLKRQGYTLEMQVLNAMHFGVPQNRERLFLVGSLNKEKFTFPDPTTEIVSVKDALCDLPQLTNGNKDIAMPYVESISTYAMQMRGQSEVSTNNGVSTNTDIVLKRYNHIPQGGNWKNIPTKLMGSYADASRCHTGIYHRLHEEKPSVVIGNYRKNMLIHPWQDRGLSVREAARLQSFPDTFRFVGSLNSQQQQVGNAVPPKLAKAVFEKIIVR